MTEAKAKGILFSGEMVRAIIDGRKTVTRRIMKPQPQSVEDDPESFESYPYQNGTNHMLHGPRECPPGFRPIKWFRFDYETDGRIEYLRPGVGVKPTTRQAKKASEFLHRYKSDGVRWTEGEVIGLCRYQPGDVLYVKEKTLNVEAHGYLGPVYANTERAGEIKAWGLRPAADDVADAEGHEVKWRPSMIMPRKYARLFLRVESVTVERLQEISREDVRREGVPDTWGDWHTSPPKMEPHEWDNKNYLEQWRWVWESINGKVSWESNPWVWRIAFTRIEKPE